MPCRAGCGWKELRSLGRWCDGSCGARGRRVRQEVGRAASVAAKAARQQGRGPQAQKPPARRPGRPPGSCPGCRPASCGACSWPPAPRWWHPGRHPPHPARRRGRAGSCEAAVAVTAGGREGARERGREQKLKEGRELIEAPVRREARWERASSAGPGGGTAEQGHGDGRPGWCRRPRPSAAARTCVWRTAGPGPPQSSRRRSAAPCRGSAWWGACGQGWVGWGGRYTERGFGHRARRQASPPLTQGLPAPGPPGLPLVPAASHTHTLTHTHTHSLTWL